MSNWRDRILREFTPDVARLTLVSDPDGLLLEEGVLAGIRERGFELIPFEEHIPFRYAYESKFRSRWDRSEQTDSAVVLRYAADGLDSLPYGPATSRPPAVVQPGGDFSQTELPRFGCVRPRGSRRALRSPEACSRCAGR